MPQQRIENTETELVSGIIETADDDWNAELEAEVRSSDVKSLIVYSRDWTVETIVSQVRKRNIDLNPSFQRRNAWNDKKRSKLIESLIIGVPVPEIVLAEDKDTKRSFIVIDGKQRLLAVAGFIDPEKHKSWSVPKLKNLTTRDDLNGKTYKDLLGDVDQASLLPTESPDCRQLLNADIRCTVISNYASNEVLYDVFYRLNSASVPLGSQELRQVLNKGKFADFLIESTNNDLPLHRVLNLSGPDARLRDAEILLRFLSFSIYGQEYNGNLTPFLDKCMADINATWITSGDDVKTLTNEFNQATMILENIFPEKKVGRKFAKDVWETRFNRALFEVEVFYFAELAKILGADIDSR